MESMSTCRSYLPEAENQKKATHKIPEDETGTPGTCWLLQHNEETGSILEPPSYYWSKVKDSHTFSVVTPFLSLPVTACT